MAAAFCNTKQNLFDCWWQGRNRMILKKLKGICAFVSNPSMLAVALIMRPVDLRARRDTSAIKSYDIITVSASRTSQNPESVFEAKKWRQRKDSFDPLSIARECGWDHSNHTISQRTNIKAQHKQTCFESSWNTSRKVRGGVEYVGSWSTRKQFSMRASHGHRSLQTCHSWILVSGAW